MFNIDCYNSRKFIDMFLHTAVLKSNLPSRGHTNTVTLSVSLTRPLPPPHTWAGTGKPLYLLTPRAMNTQLHTAPPSPHYMLGSSINITF